MANTKEYLIRINGLEESINAVESLNKQLGLLESKINALSSKAVNISSSSGGGGSRSGALSEEEKLQKQIAQTEEKRIAYQKDIYQTLLAEKDLLKETVNDQKQVAAQERLTADAYSNTMQGMKDKLADIKAVMQTVDLGDVDTFEKLTKDANELNAKLLEIEKSYGQFGRNVGNYASAFDGLKNIQVTVGNTVREFGSAREAFRTLGEELKALSINGQANTKHADELREAYNKLKSAMDDATLSSKAMDEAMDWMQSFTSMASVGQGFKGFFGIGGDEIQRSIQKLVSLQNVLQGIEKINKQIDSGEGFGKYIGSLNKGVDKVTNRLLAFNRSLNGTGTYAKAASVAIKGFGMALKAVGVGLAITAISKLVDAFSDLFSSSKKVEEQNKRLQQSFDVLTSEIDRRNEALDAAQQAGIISEQEKLTAQFDNQLELLDRQVELLERRAALQGENIGIGSIKQGTSLLGDVDVFNSKISFTPNWGGAVDTVVNNMEELTTLYGRYTKALEEADKANEEWATALTLSGEEIRQNTEYYQNMRNQMEKMAFGHYVSEVQKLDRAYKDGRISAEFYEKKMKDLKKAMEVDQAYQNALVHMKDLFGENAEAADALAKSIDNIFRSIQRGDVTNLINIRNAISGLSRMLKTDLENAYDDIDQWEKEQINNITGETEAAEEARTAIKVTAQLKRKKLLEEHQKEELEKEREANRKVLDASKKYADSENEVYSTMYALRLKLMKDSLTKQLMQLDEEKRQTLNKLKNNNQAYLEAERAYFELRNLEIEKYIKEQNKLLGEQEKSLVNSAYDNEINEIENRINRLLLTVPSINELFTEDEISANQRYHVVLNYLQLVEKAQSEGLDKLTENEKSAYEKLSEDSKKVLATELETIKSYTNLENLSLQESFKIRIRNARTYYAETVSQLTKAIEDERELKEKQINFQFSADTYAAAERLKAQQDSYQNEIDAAQKGLEALQKIADSGHTNLTNEQRKHWKEYTDIILVNQEYIKKATSNYYDEIEQLEKQKDNTLFELNLQTIQRRSDIQEKYFNEQLSNYRDFQSKINQEISKQPVYDSYGFGIINLAKTKKNYKEIRNAVNETLQSIQSDKAKLNEDWQNGLLTPEAYSATLRQLNDVEKSVIESGENITEDLKESEGEWWGAIHEWLQRVADAASQIMTAIWEYQDNVYDRQVRDIEKAIDEQEKLLDKQKDIIQKHADAVNSIEDELSSARGDRRQHLIDQLNAEIQAQRAAAEEEKQLEKKKQALEKQKEKMAKDQWEKDKARNITTALMNAAMAVSQAAVNKWPIPAVPLMAIAAAIGAAQVAAIEAQRYPYAKGGLLEGPSHSQGGIPVGNTGIEVEGQEYVIRKKSTRENVPVLDFINKSERKLTLDDFIDFYSTKPRATIKNIRSKFADGGVLTTPNVDISNFSDRTIIVKDEGIYEVSVVDINRKQEQVKNIQVLAGIGK